MFTLAREAALCIRMLRPVLFSDKSEREAGVFLLSSSGRARVDKSVSMRPVI